MAGTRKTGMRKSLKQQKKQQQQRRQRQQKKQQRKSMKKGGLRRRRNTMRGGAKYTLNADQGKVEIALEGDETLADGSQIVIVTPTGEGGNQYGAVVVEKVAPAGEQAEDRGEPGGSGN